MRLPARLKRSRHGIYYFRLLIPKRLRHCCGGRAEVQHSLHTRDPHIARHWAIYLAARLTEFWGESVANDDKRPKLNWPTQGVDINRHWTADLRKGIYEADPSKPGDEEGLLKFVKEVVRLNPKVLDPAPVEGLSADAVEQLTKGLQKSVAEVVALPENPTPVRTAYVAYVRHLTQTQPNPKTRAKYLNAVSELVGDLDTKFVHEVTPKHIMAFRTARTQADGNSLKTFDLKLTALRNFFGWARKNGHYPNTDLPTQGQRSLTKRDERRITKSYEPFTFDELQKIFEPKTYRKQNCKQPHYYWLPLLALFTGARIEELCQLDLADVRHYRNIPYIDLNELDDKGLKTPAATRRVPLHSTLIDLGFLEYVTDVKKALPNAKKIFPYLVVDKFGKRSTAASKKMNRYLAVAGVKNSRAKVFHSFRHTANQELTDQGVSLELRCALVGHDINNENAETYTEPFPVARLYKDGIEKMRYTFVGADRKLRRLDLKPLRYQSGEMIESLSRLVRTRPAAAIRKSNAMQRAKNERGVSYVRNGSTKRQH